MKTELWIHDPVTAKPSLHGVRNGRRLIDKVLVAFHHACDQGDLQTAEELLVVGQHALARGAQPQAIEKRRCRDALVAAYERLWHLRHRFQDLQ